MTHLDFADFDNNWWTEGGQSCHVEDGRLVMRAEGTTAQTGLVCTAWHKNLLPADFSVELDAHVLSSPADANNINLFFGYSDPSGTPLFDTRASRKYGEYDRYHNLN